MKRNTPELRGNLVLDTSVLVEYLTGSSGSGEIVREYFAGLGADEKIHLNLYTISEVYYILCRIKGSKFASEKLETLFTSKAVSIHPSSLELALKIGQMKCERALSITDCATLAQAESLKFPVAFVREKELEKEISKKPFDVEVLLLLD